MAISRKPCEGRRPDGKRCRKWKDLNSEGFCPTCSNVSGGDGADVDERCGMCPLIPNIALDVNDSTPTPNIMVQCNWCDEWFHGQCIGTSSFQSYIGQEPPTDEGNHNNGSKALHLWFCAGCATKQKNIFKDIVTFLKKKSSVGEVASRQLVDGERAHTSPQTSQTPPVTRPTPVATAGDNSNNTTQTTPATKPVSRGITFEKMSSNCPFFKKGRCRHGKSGNKVVNGQKCMYSHPKLCVQFCRYGWDLHKLQQVTSSCLGQRELS